MPDGARDGVGQHAFERALAQLAEQQAEQEILLVGGRAPDQLAQQLRRVATPIRRPTTPARRSNSRVDLAELERRRRRPAARRAVAGQDGAADLHPALTRLAAQKGDDDRDFVRRHPGEQIGQVADFSSRPAVPATAREISDDLGETHPPIVSNPDAGRPQERGCR